MSNPFTCTNMSINILREDCFFKIYFSIMVCFLPLKLYITVSIYVPLTPKTHCVKIYHHYDLRYS